MKNKLCRKLVSLTLAFALAIGMMPAIPGAVHVAHADTAISTVHVLDIAAPVIGEKPDYEASLLTGNGYFFSDDITGYSQDQNGILWLEDEYPMDPDTPFEQGKTYTVRVELGAEDGYVFAEEANLTSSINEKSAYIQYRIDKWLNIEYNFGPSKESIDSVALTMEGHELNGLIRGLTFDSDDPITVGSDYGTDKNYVVYLQNTTQHLTSETGEFYGWQQYYVGYYLEAKAGYVFNSLTPNQVTLNGQSAYSLTNQNDGRVLAIFALEKLGYIHEIELEVPLPAAGQQITKPTVVSVDGDPSLNYLVSTEGSQWSASSFFIDGAEYEKVSSGNFQNGVAYKLNLEACPADTNTYYLADDCKVTVKTSDGQILQRGQTWSQDGWYYKQTNYFNLNAPTAYDTLKNWDMEINGYNGGASLLGLSAKVTANGKTLMLPAGETLMIYEESFAEPEPPYLIKYDTQYILTMPLLTADMNWPGVDWVIDDIDNVKITLHGQPLSVSDLMNMDDNWWVMYKLPILKQGTTCNGLTHDYESVMTPATFDQHGESHQKCKGCGLDAGSSTIPKVSTVQLTQTEYTYNGKSQCPGVIVKDSTGSALKEGQDYSLMKPSDSSAAGTYTITVILKGNYSGSKDLTFRINAVGSSGGSNGGGSAVTPTPTPAPGGSVQPAPTPTPGTPDTGTPDTPASHQHSYVKTVTKATSKKDGSIVEKCACGDVKSSVVIKKASGIKLSKSAYVYTGKVIKAKNLPKVIVKDSAGKTIAKSNYTIVKPKNVKKMKALGKYAYIVKFKGDKYKGSVKVYLEITPAKVTAKAPKAAKRAVTVTWKKGKKAQVTGYEVTVSTNKKFTKNVKTKKIKGYGKTSYKMTKLKAKTKYYVKVRAYKVTKTGTVYGPWSAVKNAKTK